MLMVANEMQSGCAVLPQIDPMYGENNSSEARQAMEIIRQLPDNSIVLGDIGFGIFSVSYRCVSCGHDILFRLSVSRFKALRREAKLTDQARHTRPIA
jgi:hypothetical protein